MESIKFQTIAAVVTIVSALLAVLFFVLWRLVHQNKVMDAIDNETLNHLYMAALGSRDEPFVRAVLYVVMRKWGDGKQWHALNKHLYEEVLGWRPEFILDEPDYSPDLTVLYKHLDKKKDDPEEDFEE